jgi:hypothetical protein
MALFLGLVGFASKGGLEFFGKRSIEIVHKVDLPFVLPQLTLN